uniref:NADH-ubiquinone oxidoreductase chain 5 n=1 Tax=Moolgarda cunnesius TaxID=1111463 RepID=I1T2I5_MOOCU|nr:NADH dehydrogenase subunit 5 [Moolgarda cunnesius]AEK53207.2 NADH dehydrogenase subunit 5 [Moolgarda cunnesius]
MLNISVSVMSASFLAMLLVLTTPFITLLNPLSPYPEPLKVKPIMAVSLAFFYSLIPLLIHLANGTEVTSYHWDWLPTFPFDMALSFTIDVYTIFFSPVALFVSLMIFIFTSWYMKNDPHLELFFKYMTLFLLSMLILASANNLFQLFIGWEGVGIMSFLLISWWHGRQNANAAALQALMYNRLGDIGFLVALAWFALTLGTLDMQQILSLVKKFDTTIPSVALLFAACAKSAQFGFHHWLPSAMEGPTPVSSLLHSSTMVVAGVFMLIRMSPMIAQQQAVLSACLLLGASTTLLGATCALTQFDMKKIVAYSTTSQLGLMMVAIGLGQPHLAFLHICTHAFFKAMLFICSGTIIHYLNDEQDIRKMGGLQNLAPVTSSCMVIGSLALTGTPFLAGFFSKDAIIESLSASCVNACAFVLIIIATSFTAAYSIRLIYYVLLGHPRFSPRPSLDESNPAVLVPLIALAVGSIIVGMLITCNVIPTKTPVLTLPPALKLVGLIASIFGFIMAYDITRLTHLYPEESFSPKHTLPALVPLIFSSLLGFIPSIFHRLLPLISLLLGRSIASQIIDYILSKKIGPKLLSKLNKMMATHTNDLQRGLIKIYLTFFLMTLIIAPILISHYYT